jgi:capsular exopolysaccharide synthesis family protein
LTKYASVLARYWLYVVGVFIVALLIGAIITIVSPKKYESNATLYVSAQTGSDNAYTAYQGSLLSEQRVKSYLQIATSDRVVAQVISGLHLSLSSDQLKEEVSATSETGTVLITISARDENPAQAAAIANEFARVFSEVVADVERPQQPNLPSPVSVRLVEAATPPLLSDAVSPRAAVNLILAALFGLVVGVLAAFTRWALDRTVTDTAQLSDLIGLPLLGQIAFSQHLSQNSLVGLFDNEGTGEQFRHLRTSLQFLDVDGERRTFLFSSSVSGEGKTSVVSNMAIVIASTGAKVLLIDADLRRPSVSSVFGLSSDVGLSSILSGRIEWRQATQRTAYSNLSVVTSGPVPPNPSELLGSQRMSNLLTLLRNEYDYVLVDSPPALSVTDAVVLAPQVDALVLVFRRSATLQSDVREIGHRFEGITDLRAGYVLNFAQPHRKDRYYYASTGVGDRSAKVPYDGETATASLDERASSAHNSRPSPSPRR